MATKQVGVSVKEARLLDQWLNTSIASVKWSELLDFFWQDMKVLAKAREELLASELYKKIWGDIEAKAHEIVDTKCRPEWNRISEEMKPIGERANELEKEKAAGGEFAPEKQTELDELNKKLADLSNSYQKVTDDANAELNAFKEERINSEQWATFFLSEKDYKTVWWYVWF